MIRPLRCLLIGVVALSSSFLHADERVDSLSQEALQEAFRILKRDYIRQDALSYLELNRAALDGLLARLGTGASLVTKNGDENQDGAEVSFHSEMLPAKAGYIRLASYKIGEIEQLDAAIENFKNAEAQTLILDLRVPQLNAELEAAARVLDRFVESNTMLFKIQKSTAKQPTMFFSQVTETRWDWDLVLLVDSETCNAGEVIAGCIQANRECIIVGSKTPGLTVQYEQIALNEDTLLRYAVAEIVLGDNTHIFKKGIEPTILLGEDLDAKHKVLAASEGKSLQQFISEEARPRMNEASLVHEFDPELDYHLARARGEMTKYDSIPLLDTVIQRTVDLLVSVEHLNEEPDRG